jgi:hypothetical protein
MVDIGTTTDRSLHPGQALVRAIEALEAIKPAGR